MKIFVLSCLVVLGSCAKLPLDEEEPIAILRSESFKDGANFNYNLVADEEGYRVESNMLPVAPAFPHPIPAYVQEQIDFVAAQQAAGLTWDQEQGAWIRV